MKKITIIAVLLATLASCAKEEVITLGIKQARKSSMSISGQWVMQSYSINGVHTFGDESVWNFENGTLSVIKQSEKEGFNYNSNSSRIYVVNNVNDMVLEYFIDYLDSFIMTLSIGNKTYTFTRY